MCDGMVVCQTRALSSSSSSSFTSSSLAHRLAASAFLLLFTLLPYGHASGCARPPGVQHGDLLNQTEANRGSFPPGTLLAYGCGPGYTADGPTSIICTSSGAWSHQPPRCIRSNVCSPPTEPENGGYRCHPSPCHRLTQKTVIEYFCDEGYALKGDYKFLTCQNGEWDSPMQISCRLTGQDKEPSSPLGIPALSIVASTASSVALILLLVVLFVLVQPKLKSFHHSRREQGVSGQPSSIMVEGVQVTLPSYEEAVYGSSGPCSASGPPPSPPPPAAPPESRVPIVLSEGLPQGATGGQAGPSRTRHHRDLDFCLPSTSSSSSSYSSRRHAETVLVHQAPSSSSSSSSSSWAREHPGGACAGPLPLRRDSESSDQHSLLSVTSTDDFSDDIPLLKEA
ncbi:Sushi domain-containing protein 6 [Larimichthys crocea]|uniref:Sushi domain-containing protein 6 n=1 Tax=Larimichthys crocea TaxID=215358 RepID=A0A6G0I5G2_LARCR|nr:sushi domain-containing protein 6 [Larimichthys crocea]XP_019117178.1 sushi domain-containing protein 6 [Larimichthys crocea]KAE8286705.1 Sushi domain-containing protein 6 [Larimichthys crocea]